MGIFFWYPLAGVNYQMLHYMLGLRALGWDVYYIEDTYRSIYDPYTNEYSYEYDNVLKHVVPVLEKHGFKDRWACRDGYGGMHGMDEPSLHQLYKDCDAALNVTGGHDMNDEHMVIKKRIYVESDPFAMQVAYVKGSESDQGFIDRHNYHFTFGENYGEADCGIPITGHNWMPTRQPVHMDLWLNETAGGDTYNTITTWQNKHEPTEWKGESYAWTKDIEFKKYLDLPLKRPKCNFEMASGVEEDVLQLLRRNGWRYVDANAVSLDHLKYRDYIIGSRGEFTVAREQYWKPRTGWFSDRSVAYLAAGRPVITRETGFSKFVPAGRGLFAYQNMGDILVAVDAIESDYQGHSRAAREIADEYFCSKRVLASLMSRAGLG
jgi:hypothetical protein